ncbi:Mycolic acid cyclopropane synthetase-domain-containing protein [Lophiotrema nucula]|uniref:Mycolic acid cyclopropane synthetase-domain-containing protein n=1 Tax=Lophiotrema nucula TaxID=690887 RepID=A0A6A5ZJG6_9PLEO|nr:Mycolic acid cyclopropane synthetase-domain-containing protein [Lophiotrema nucula]
MGIPGVFEPHITRFARASILATLEKIQHGRLTVVIKDGIESNTVSFGSTKEGPDTLSASVVILDSSVWTRLCSNMDAGFAESYMLQQLECENLVNLFLIYIKNWDILGSGNLFFQLVPKLFRLLGPKNDPAHALKNASFHYDTSNDLFAGFLSPDMNYSSAMWSADHTESLEASQMRKVQGIIRKARISSTDHVLDIGGGWGSLAIEAVKMTGCRVTATSLSKEQKELFDERVKVAGLSDRIEMVLCDYRSTPMPKGGYDRIISIEMLEHVGREYMHEYFASISKLLKKEGGIMVVQGITMIQRFHDFRKKNDNFIDRYIFPGGYLPPINGLLGSIQQGSKGELEVESVESIGPHYIKTLRLWGEKFEQNWPSIRDKKPFNQLTNREQYYFLYCEAGFRAGVLGDHQVCAVRKPMELPPGVPL